MAEPVLLVARELGHRASVAGADSAVTAEWSQDDAGFLIDIGAPRLVVDTTDGYAPDLGRVIAFARAGETRLPAGFSSTA